MIYAGTEVRCSWKLFDPCWTNIKQGKLIKDASTNPIFISNSFVFYIFELLILYLISLSTDFVFDVFE